MERAIERVVRAMERWREPGRIRKFQRVLESTKEGWRGQEVLNRAREGCGSQGGLERVGEHWIGPGSVIEAQ